MVSISRRADRPGWVVRWRDEAKAQHKRTFRRKLDADRFRAHLEHQLHTGTYVDPAAGRVPFRQYAEEWRAMQPGRTATARRRRMSLETHVYPVIGHRPIAAVRPSEVQALIAGMSTTLAPGSVRTVYATLRAVFRAAARDQVIARNPCEAAKLPAATVEQVVPLTVDQVEAIAAAMPARLQALVIVAAGTGLRRGELLGIQLGDVDFLRRQVRVERQRHGKTLLVGPPKNQAAHRTVPVGETVLTALSEHVRLYPPGTGFVFPISSETRLYRTWQAAAAAAGVPTATLHDLRHFYASALIRAGLSVKVVSDRLGHSNAAMTLNVYSHLWGDDEDRTRSAIDTLFQPGAPQVRPAREV